MWCKQLLAEAQREIPSKPQTQAPCTAATTATGYHRHCFTHLQYGRKDLSPVVPQGGPAMLVYHIQHAKDTTTTTQDVHSFVHAHKTILKQFCQPRHY